jgi:hypothetical protein
MRDGEPVGRGPLIGAVRPDAAGYGQNDHSRPVLSTLGRRERLRARCRAKGTHGLMRYRGAIRLAAICASGQHV